MEPSNSPASAFLYWRRLYYLAFVFDQSTPRSPESDWQARENEEFFDAMLVFLEHDEATNSEQENKGELS